jgi:hypothetical protein
MKRTPMPPPDPAKALRRDPDKPLIRTVPLAPGTGKIAARKKGIAPSPAQPFPPEVAALLAERDPWCVHCGSPYDLQNHHRRLKGIGGDPRPHTQCACNGVRLCRACHIPWAHEAGRDEAEVEGVIIPRSVIFPGSVSVAVHTEEDAGGLTLYPTCDGRWTAEPPEGLVA